MRVPTHGAVITEAEDEALMEVIKKRWYTEGDACRSFRAKLSNFTGMREVVLCNSGSSANLLALSILRQPELGDRQITSASEVITTALNFPTTVSPIIQMGAHPIFIDIDLPSMVPSVDKVLDAITHKTRAIVLAHTLGYPAPIRELRKECETRGIWLVEDCCDALGSPYTMEADIATLSFFPAHQICAAEGGALLTRSPALAKIARSLRDWGKDCWCSPGEDNTCGKRFAGEYDHKYTFARLGYNLKMTEFQGALGSAQMDQLPEFIRRRSANHAYLNACMAKAGMDEFFILPPALEASWFGYCLICKPPIARNDLVAWLELRGVQTRMVFGGNLLRQPALRGAQYRVHGGLDNTNLVHDNAFWIGCWPGLCGDQMDYAVNSIVEYCRRVI